MEQREEFFASTMHGLSPRLELQVRRTNLIEDTLLQASLFLSLVCSCVFHSWRVCLWTVFG